MFDKNKKYTLNELLDMFGMYNIEFKYFGNNDRGDLELFMKTDVDKMSVFRSINKQTKKDYLKLDEDTAKNVKFKFDREEYDLELDIVAFVIRTSDVNIPATRYKLTTLDKLTKEQDMEDREVMDGLSAGISYIIVDNNTACTLYDNVYEFGKDKKGLIEELREELKNENNSLRRDNLKLILNYYDNLTEKENYSL